jgi:hypothetical protein
MWDSVACESTTVGFSFSKPNLNLTQETTANREQPNPTTVLLTVPPAAAPALVELSFAIFPIRLTLQWRVEGELKLQLSAEMLQLSAVADQPRLSNFFSPAILTAKESGALL